MVVMNHGLLSNETKENYTVVTGVTITLTWRYIRLLITELCEVNLATPSDPYIAALCVRG